MRKAGSFPVTPTSRLTLGMIVLGYMIHTVSSAEVIGLGLCFVLLLPALIVNGGQLSFRRRRLLSSNDDDPTSTLWDTNQQNCFHTVYDMKLLVETKEGHLLLLATPAMAEEAHEEEEEEDDEIGVVVDDGNDNVCGSYLIHTMKIGKDDSWVVTINVVDRNFVQDLSYEDMAFVSYELDDVERTLGDIASAIDMVGWNDEDDNGMYYQWENIMVPTNCATFLLELFKYLEIPITNDMISFVMTHVQNSNFMKRFTTDDIYHNILAKQSWFGGIGNGSGNVVDDTAATANVRKLGTDPVSMLRRLGEFMLERQYPKELMITDD